ncbi:MAG: twin-arginine translocase subunit TatC [Acidimicrobiaceae bacterium]|nr:twin-arginine translocase subunit TatC [Acidimicrobiaceae bacterium]
MAITDDRAEAAPEPSDNGLGTMTLFEHLSELRRRLLWSILAVVVTTVAAWFFYNQLLHFMRNPYCDFIHHHHGKSISGCNLVTTGPLEGFTTRIKVSAYAGIALAAPVWLWQLWRFITPGLYKNEKRYIVPFVAAAIGLFALGVTTAVLVFPKALDWLISVSGQGVVPLFSPSRYFTLYMAMAVIFGLVFMYPLVVVFLEIAGVVPSKTWRKWRRVAIVVICAVAAVITPSSDPFSFMGMAIPMLVFYEGSILLGRALGK